MSRLSLLSPEMMCDAQLFISPISELSVDYPMMVTPLAGRPTLTELLKISSPMRPTDLRWPAICQYWDNPN